ncbi:MAG: EamA family transporter [Chitinophagaceae bacterium]|nr:EamA family transporter [Chitinophagaceae bacterium]
MSNKFINWSIFVLLCFIWGSSFILMKESQRGMTAPQIASLRIFSAALVFIPFGIFHITKLPKKKWSLIALTGVFGNLFPAFCFAIAIMNIDSSLAGILNSLTPICVVTIGVLVFNDKFKTQRIVGVLIGLAGLCLTMAEKEMSFNNWGYTLLVIAGTISYGINVNLVSHHLKHLNPIYLATVSLSFMFIPAAILLWYYGFLDLDFSDEVVQWSVLNSVLLGIVASSIATVLFYTLVQKAGGLFASLVTYGIPFIALFWGFIYKESITITTIVGLVIILLGVFLANRPERKEVESGPLPKPSR